MYTHFHKYNKIKKYRITYLHFNAESILILIVEFIFLIK